MHGFLHHIHFRTASNFPHLQYGIRVRCLQPQTVVPFFAVSRPHGATGGHEKARLVTLQQQVPYLILVPANRMIVPKRNEHNFVFQNVNIFYVPGTNWAVIEQVGNIQNLPFSKWNLPPSSECCCCLLLTWTNDTCHKVLPVSKGTIEKFRRNND